MGDLFIFGVSKDTRNGFVYVLRAVFAVGGFGI